MNQDAQQSDPNNDDSNRGYSNKDLMQPVSTSTGPRRPSPDPTNDPVNDVVPQRLPYWLRQAERFLRVIVRIYLGLLVCFAPWYPLAWDSNPLFAQSPWLLSIVTNGAVRGLVSGLGLLNLWIALRDAMRPPEESEPGRR